MMRWILAVLGLILIHVYPVIAQNETPSPDYFARVSVDNTTPYVGQQITYTFRFYDAVNVSRPNYMPPDFEGFWQIADLQAEGSVEQIDNRQYIVSQLTTALFPTRPGSLTIEPARVLLPETVYRDEDQIVTDALTIQVMPLPDGAPREFSGAVGVFEMSATLDRQTIQLGEPVTLRLIVSGTGNVEQLTLPDRPVPESWRWYPNPTTYRSSRAGEQVIGEKVYEYQIFPDEIGSQTLPPITLSYFDPVDGTYQLATTASVVIEVLPGQTVAKPTEVNQSTMALALKAVPSVLQSQSHYPGGLIWLLWLVPPFGLMVCAGYVAWERKQQKNRILLRQSRALQAAQKRLRAATRMSDVKGYALIQVAVEGYLKDKMGVQSNSKRQSDWKLLLENASIPAPLKDKVRMCMELGDEGRYAPGMGLSIADLSKQTEQVLQAIDEGWKSS